MEHKYTKIGPKMADFLAKISAFLPYFQFSSNNLQENPCYDANLE